MSSNAKIESSEKPFKYVIFVDSNPSETVLALGGVVKLILLLSRV